MKELLEKISSYNLFNYLFPGIIFVVFLEKTTQYTLPDKDIFVSAFIYYFIGLIISRISSLIVEPIFKKFKFITFAPYKDYVLMSQKDKTIEILSEVNNMYRTLISVFLLLLSCKLYEQLSIKFAILQNNAIYILLFALLVLFIFSYRKQTAFITDRINANKEEE